MRSKKYLLNILIYLLLLLTLSFMAGCGADVHNEVDVDEDTPDIPLAEENSGYNADDRVNDEDKRDAAENSEEELELQAGDFSLPSPGINENGVTGALLYRQSRRDFAVKPLEVKQVATLLWSAGGVNIDGVSGPTRTAPSAGATYPLDVYLVAGAVDGLKAGVYRYDHINHELIALREGDRRKELANIAGNQGFIVDAPVHIILVAFYERTTGRYGERGVRYVHMDAGYYSQNIYLVAEEMGLGAVAVGAFCDDSLKEFLHTDGEPLLVMSTGYIR